MLREDMNTIKRNQAVILSNQQSIQQQFSQLLKDNEALIHPIKAIMVKKEKPGVLRPEEVYDLSNEPSNEEELRAYQSRFGIPEGS